MKKTYLSPEAREVWGVLTQKQKRIIQKDYPLKEDRNIEICRLRARGVKQPILVEITGLSRQMISDITGGGVTVDELSVVKRDLKELQRVTGRLGHHISAIEKDR